jgi:hypothetical protein
MNTVNNMFIYISLCNGSVFNAYIGGFEWTVLGSNITNPQVLPYLPISTYAPMTTTSITSTTTNNVSESNLIITNILFIIGPVYVLIVVVVLSGAVCYRQ